MKYKVIRNKEYDFLGQSYTTVYPNLHKYPATMIPQIGIKILKELDISSGTLLDPYCGSGSSFAAGLEAGIKEMYGNDINPLAVLISQAKFTKVDLKEVNETKQDLRNKVFEFIKDESNLKSLVIPDIYNNDFWFSPKVLENLAILRLFVDQIENKNIKNLFLMPLSETIRECSYTRNNEFKLYRMKSEDILKFNPDVMGVFFDKLFYTIEIYKLYYHKKLNKTKVKIRNEAFHNTGKEFDLVLTSPPYGDSRTTVAYGQFSMFTNAWLGIEHARKLDSMMMGGKASKEIYEKGVLKKYIEKVEKVSEERSLEVSSFYSDLEDSIIDVSKGIKKKGYSIYVVGNRTVKGIQLPTDQFIAEKFTENGFKHKFTFSRSIGNKVMPSRNSPSNVAGKLQNTMTEEYIIVSQKL